MTIASEIARLQGVKSDILGAIAEKKVDVPTGAMLADAPDLIRSIKSGINVKIGQGVYPAVKIGNQLWLAKNLDENLGMLYGGQTDFSSSKVDGAAISVSSYNVGDVVSLTPTSLQTWECAIVEIKKDDVITISCRGGDGPRSYAILNSRDELIEMSPAQFTYTSKSISVSENGKIIINNNKSFGVELSIVRTNNGSADEWYYNNDEATYKKYGRLYTWNNLNENLVKLGLTKWRWPTKEDFETLIENCGGSSVAGGVLKSTTLWKRNVGTDNFGFSLLPCGRLANGNFSGVGEQSSSWSSTENGSNAYNMYITMNDSSVLIPNYPKTNGRTIRLVMDLNDDGTIPDSNIVIDETATTAEPLALASEPIVTEEE